VPVFGMNAGATPTDPSSARAASRRRSRTHAERESPASSEARPKASRSSGVTRTMRFPLRLGMNESYCKRIDMAIRGASMYIHTQYISDVNPWTEDERWLHSRSSLIRKSRSEQKP